MSNIALPKKVEFQKGEDVNSSRIIVGPCYPGYGITLGNALRRVMLSSLPGAAVVGIKIKGVDHEFMALPHLKEDILEFILNLKQLRMKVYSDEVVKLDLKIYGEKTITAANIEKNSQVEIVNSDLVLGHVTDMAGRLEAEIFVKKGMGYEMIENREEKNKEIGYIEMDSIFSPIVSVGVKIENTRVGKMTNWESLLIDVKTDGVITCEEAFNASVEILINQFMALAPEKGGAGNEDASSSDTVNEVSEINESINEDGDEQGDDGAKKKRGRPKKA